MGQKSANLARFLTQEGVTWKLQYSMSMKMNALWPHSRGPDLDLMKALPPINHIHVWWYSVSPFGSPYTPDLFRVRAYTEICIAQIGMGILI